MSTKVNAVASHPFFQLREKLSPLRFDPAQDVPVSSQPFMQDYLKFYQLDVLSSVSNQHFVGTLQSDEYTIVAQYWLPTLQLLKGTVFVLHGYYDHVGLFHHLIRFLLEQGFAVVAYDQPGHGLSSGEQASINHFSEYVSVLQICLQHARALPAAWFAIGTSTGGGVLLHALLVERVESPFTGIVLMAPLVRPAGWTLGQWTYCLLHRWVTSMPRHYAENSHDQAFLDFCRGDPLQSTRLSVRWVSALKEWLEQFPSLLPARARALLLQGDEDGTVDWRKNLPLIRKKISGLDVAIIEGARHQLANESEDLRAQIFARLRDFLLE
jgi:lysophospholipase